ncbi:hypothetical protein BTA51_04915 [Hahella sp. CCB-MM4]|uniref:class I SAM-dependent methyltransferase n=1 Tax=Hahella sp. (strain CCB-MM4) TaxID=1926491 RepID=UPI000BCA292F|nr:class I SAM-dependent methyltransferase [Hahella sp. CCB-MM4]OZG74356.1 hypothetical protein BTA51_04915 [Hahella sp. CCB-MM4]
MSNDSDRWSKASSYEYFMGRWSRRIAPRFLSWLGLPSGIHWLDVGCGTGSLTGAISSQAHPASVVGCDPAESFIEFARSNYQHDQVSFATAGIGNLPSRPGGYDSISSMFALNFFPDADTAIHEMRSLAAPRGTVSACVWDYAKGMEFLRSFWDVATELDQSAKELDEGNRFPLCHQEALADLFVHSGFHDVKCEAVEIPTEFASFDDYWKPFMGETGPASAYVASIGDDLREEISRRLSDVLPRKSDGSIALNARAWAVKGTVA